LGLVAGPGPSSCGEEVTGAAAILASAAARFFLLFDSAGSEVARDAIPVQRLEHPTNRRKR